MQLTLTPLDWRLRDPFITARETIASVPALLVELQDEAGNRGRGEAVGIDYAGETPASMMAQLEELRGTLERLVWAERVALSSWLPAGGARNALDAALWDLEAKATRIPVWRLAGMSAPKPLITAFTIGLGDLDTVRRSAHAHAAWPLLKVKVDARRHLGHVRAVREAAPRARLIVDANGSWSDELLQELSPQLHRLGVEAIEQPLPADGDSLVISHRYSVPLCADESFQDLRSLDRVRNRYEILNLKLDKTGGLTEALVIARAARKEGFRLMAGNMCGSSLAIAPAVLLAQLCDLVDLDGPLLQVLDWKPALEYCEGRINHASPALWG